MIVRVPGLLGDLGRRDVANPISKPPSASGSPSVATTDAAATDTESFSQDFRPLIVVSSIMGAAVLVMAIITACIMVRRSRKRRSQATAEYTAARQRDPNLSWQEYERRCKLSNSTMFLEAESQRALMISKSLKSRPSLDRPELAEDAVITDPGLPPSPPTPTKASLWTRGRRHASGPEALAMNDSDMEDKEMLLSPSQKPQFKTSPERPGSSGSAGSLRSPVHSSSNSSRRWVWELPDGKKCPPAWANSNARWSGDLRDAPPPVPPPSIRARTPPIWAHPAFRPEGSGMGIVARSYTNDTGLLPSERIKEKPASLNNVTGLLPAEKIKEKPAPTP
ncbi:hypothetical protein MCOR30_004576 [Pyricularia oryzae]|nr:hypothetical protein MCOR30_004576 [Pyricularia oryzae]